MHCYFHLISPHQTIPDEEGVEVENLDQARAASLEVAAEVIRASKGDLAHWRGWRLEVRNGSEAVLFAINLDDLLG